MKDYDNTTREERAKMYNCNGNCYGTDDEPYICGAIDDCPATSKRELRASVVAILLVLVFGLVTMLALIFFIVGVIKGVI